MPKTTEPSPGLPAASPRRWPVVLGFAAWAALTGLFGAWTLAQHSLPFAPARPAAQPGSGDFVAWHILGSDCGCSEAVADELVRRGPRPGWREQVRLIGDEPALAARVRAAGFAVDRTDGETLAREHGIQGAPWLALFDRAGAVRYSGGYTARRPGQSGGGELSGDLMAAVAAGDAPAALPAFGCPVSQETRTRLDPLGLKFRSSP